MNQLVGNTVLIVMGVPIIAFIPSCFFVYDLFSKNVFEETARYPIELVANDTGARGLYIHDSSGNDPCVLIWSKARVPAGTDGKELVCYPLADIRVFDAAGTPKIIEKKVFEILGPTMRKVFWPLPEKHLPNNALVIKEIYVPGGAGALAIFEKNPVEQ